jgi:tetratricopeptide (TPR) repeat protein
MIFLFRESISDIQRQLKCDQVKSPLRVYRSQMMSSDELDHLKRHIGQFISVNSFFSTSTNRETALFFLGDKTSFIDSKLERVLFEVDANPKMVTTKPFADISQSSQFTDESEVLFMSGSIFRLKSINCNDDQVWIIEMSLCSDDENDLKHVLLHIKQQIGDGETNLRTLGKVLWKMGKLDLAEKYFKRLLNQLSLTDHLLCNLYEDLGELASQIGDYDISVQCHQKFLQLKKRNQLTEKSNKNTTDKSISEFIQTDFISFK